MGSGGGRVEGGGPANSELFQEYCRERFNLRWQPVDGFERNLCPCESQWVLPVTRWQKHSDKTPGGLIRSVSSVSVWLLL